jgi:two-component system, NarL family, response regulator LiaR
MGIDMDRIRLLICDDHRILTDALVAVVSAQEDFELVSEPVHEPGEAVRRCAELRPDVVLMDLSFAGEMSGIRATRDIRDVSPATHVVIMTAHHDDRLRVEAIEAGAAGYLSKTEGAAAVLEAARAAARGDVLLDPRALAPLLERVARDRATDRELQVRFDRLTRRESEVLGLLAGGLGTDEIAARLFISPFTVHTHVGSVLGKLEVRSKTQAVTLAHRVAGN